MTVSSDIVTRLRRWTHAVDAAPASDLMDEAADEIERLRCALAAYTESVSAGCKAKLTLTDAEREVIEWAANAMRPDCRATLRGLLERTQGGAATDASDAK